MDCEVCWAWLFVADRGFVCICIFGALPAVAFCGGASVAVVVVVAVAERCNAVRSRSFCLICSPFHDVGNVFSDGAGRRISSDAMD